MSKATKFLSIGIDILKAMPESEFSNDDREVLTRLKYMNADRMYKAMQLAENHLYQSNIKQKSEPEATKGEVEVNVTSGGRPLLCDVRFYALKDNETLKPDFKVNGRIDMVRLYTNDAGKLKTKLPEGRYVMELSKGSEYALIDKEIVVSGKKALVVNEECPKLFEIEALGWHAGDLHHHSIFSSPVYGGTDDVIETAREVSESMRASGLRFGALSDHHNIFNHKDWKATKTEDFHPIPSKEISTSNGHVLSLGVDGYDVIYRIPEAEDRTENYLRSEFVRITDEIKAHHGLPQLNHPRDLSISISWNPDFYDMTGIFETMEIWNGSNPMYFGTTNAMAAVFWRSLLEKGQFIPATTGSDTHNIKANDYHKLYGEMVWMCDYIKKIFGTKEEAYVKEYLDELKDFVFICEKLLPMLEKWAETNLTSGGVRTYVHIEGERTTEKILDALRKGHSFLTDGPILIPSVNGKGPGETIKPSAKAECDIRLLANRKLTHFYVYTDQNRVTELPLKEISETLSYDYSFKFDFDLSDSKYVFFVAADDCTNLAISNPVLIEA